LDFKTIQLFRETTNAKTHQKTRKISIKSRNQLYNPKRKIQKKKKDETHTLVYSTSSANAKLPIEGRIEGRGSKIIDMNDVNLVSQSFIYHNQRLKARREEARTGEIRRPRRWRQFGSTRVAPSSPESRRR
jgi:hypothetical protein